MKKLNIIVMASGNGSNFQALIDACEAPRYPAKIITLITNEIDAGAKKRCMSGGGINCITIPSDYWRDRIAWEQAIVDKIKSYDPDIVCLAGFMKILSSKFFEQWHKPVLNIHPSLLPKYKGLDAQKQAFDAGETTMGCTVHYVDETLDGGEIIGQKEVKRTKKDTLETITAKILKQEHKLYPAMLKKVAREILNPPKYEWKAVSEWLKESNDISSPHHDDWDLVGGALRRKIK